MQAGRQAGRQTDRQTETGRSAEYILTDWLIETQDIIYFDSPDDRR